MEVIFWVCVKIMITLSHVIGISYQQLNVVLFVILHPAITAFLYLKYKKYKKLYFQNKNKIQK